MKLQSAWHDWFSSSGREVHTDHSYCQRDDPLFIWRLSLICTEMVNNTWRAQCLSGINSVSVQWLQQCTQTPHVLKIIKITSSTMRSNSIHCLHNNMCHYVSGESLGLKPLFKRLTFNRWLRSPRWCLHTFLSGQRFKQMNTNESHLGN